MTILLMHRWAHAGEAASPGSELLGGEVVAGEFVFVAEGEVSGPLVVSVVVSSLIIKVEDENEVFDEVALEEGPGCNELQVPN